MTDPSNLQLLADAQISPAVLADITREIELNHHGDVLVLIADAVGETGLARRISNLNARHVRQGYLSTAIGFERDKLAIELTQKIHKRVESIKASLPDPSPNASAPLIVYHGTGTAIERFDFKFTNAGSDALGSGFYFTTDLEQAEQYALRRLSPELEKPGGEDKPNVVTAWLDIQNPMSRSTNADALTRANVIKILKSSPCLTETLENFGDVAHEGFDKVLKLAADGYVVKPGDEEHLLRVLHQLANDFFPVHVQGFNQAVHEVLGYDGVIDTFENGITHYVAFFPDQIHITGSIPVNAEAYLTGNDQNQTPEAPAG